MLLTVLDVLIEPNAAALVYGNSLVAPLANIELVPAEFFVSRYYESCVRAPAVHDIPAINAGV